MYINQEFNNGSIFEEDEQESTTNSSPTSSNSSGSSTTVDSTDENISQRLHEKFYGNNIRERRRKGLYTEKTAKEVLYERRQSKYFEYYNFSKEIEKTGEKTVPFEYETITTNSKSNYTNKKEELSENEKLWNQQQQQSHTIPRTSINQSTDVINLR